MKVKMSWRQRRERGGRETEEEQISMMIKEAEWRGEEDRGKEEEEEEEDGGN